MAFNMGELLNLGGFATEAAMTVWEHQNNVEKDKAAINDVQAQALRNNQLAGRNLDLLNEEEMATLQAHSLDTFEIAKEIRRAKATALVKRGGDGALSSSSLQSSLTNIQRLGSEAIVRKEINLGVALRNLQIESENIIINTTGLNTTAFNSIGIRTSPQATGFRLLSTGLNTFRKLGYSVDPEDGKTKPRWNTK